MHGKFEIERSLQQDSIVQVDRDNFYVARYGIPDFNYKDFNSLEDFAIPNVHGGSILKSSTFREIQQIPNSATTLDLGYSVNVSKVRALPSHITCVGFVPNYFGINLHKKGFWENLNVTIQSLPETVQWIDFGFIDPIYAQSLENVITQKPKHLKAYCISLNRSETQRQAAQLLRCPIKELYALLSPTLSLSNKRKSEVLDETELSGEKEVESQEREAKKTKSPIALLASELGLVRCPPNGYQNTFFYHNQDKEEEVLDPTNSFYLS